MSNNRLLSHPEWPTSGLDLAFPLHVYLFAPFSSPLSSRDIESFLFYSSLFPLVLALDRVLLSLT